MNFLGRALYYFTWPLIWVYAPLRLRARILVVSGEDVLVLKPYFGSGRWQLPGGGVGHKEDPAIAAKRELKEEAGINISMRPLKILDPHYVVYENGLKMRYALYTVHMPEKPSVKKRRSEVSDFAWMPLNGLEGTDNHVVYAVQMAQKQV